VPGGAAAFRCSRSVAKYRHGAWGGSIARSGYERGLRPKLCFVYVCMLGFEHEFDGSSWLTHVVECVGICLGVVLHEVAWDGLETVILTGSRHDVVFFEV
jgi:hypothetical protein